MRPVIVFLLVTTVVSAFYKFRIDQANWIPKNESPAKNKHQPTLASGRPFKFSRFFDKIHHGRFRRQSDAEDELVEALLKRVESLLFYVQEPSATLEEFFVSAIQVAAKYNLEHLVRQRIILYEIKETGELVDIIENHPGGTDEDFADGLIHWAEKMKPKFEEIGVSASAALGKVVALAFNDDFRNSDSDERREKIRNILNSREVKHDILKLPTDDEK